MISSKILITALLAFGASAVPVQFDTRDIKHSLDKEYNLKEPTDLTTTYNDPGEKREAAGHEKRCVWNDGHGDISCGYFSIVFGDNSIEGGKSKVTIRGETWKTEGNLNCGNGGDIWTTFTSPLPWTVDVHSGNACKTTISGHWDNTWVKYSAEFLNLPSDTRCGDVGKLNKSRRCLVKA
ncbi:hypothetical protein NM208_g4990 [Fusarium decemcellulare]|uniref:Uncharacterized protein n=1 Tax=Fusarium decemcellulare TaxID=57161 RepID=A0ACC1SIK6_9HYPO|nr:hypothetical protein NM208_g4990 [Fusarium decemcellulare]